ncbi:PilZ domain-containing protein, partial [uncultured Dialister sp.]|uniref:PilZ domain-containing protein n=1 Tax=uncultured Dialister sp. TaxID=278064 RepID=UPI0025958C65
MKVNHTKNLEDKLQIEKEDRRLLPNVPDPSGRRTNVDRRQGMDGEIRDSDFRAYTASAEAGRRFKVHIPVTVTAGAGGRKQVVKGICEDISSTGMLLTLAEGEKKVKEGENIDLSFVVRPGDMPEGYEMKVKKLKAEVVRRFDRDGREALGIHFKKSLTEYHQQRRRQNLI